MTEQTEPDYSKARQWLRDEGYSRDELVTAEQLRATAARLAAEAKRLAELASDVAKEMRHADALAGMRGAVRAALEKAADCA